MDSNISTYKLQLSQIQSEIIKCDDEKKKSSLLQLENSLKELIKVSSDLDSENLDAEYQLFKAELASEEGPSRNDETAENVLSDLQEDLSSLPGMKCSAPFMHSWSDQPVFHNALIFKVEEQDDVGCAEDISVRVMFTNPTHMEMKPCPYFLESDCKFSDEKCRFSHGEVVSFVSIKEYKEPDFSKLKAGATVLMKENDGLWRRANILSITEEKCLVKKESNTTEEEVDLHDLFPLDNNLEDGSSDEDEQFDQCYEASTSDIIPIIPTSRALGAWEQYTRGFGSKMMLKMGYTFGSGLGVKANGRIEPVPAVVYPSGKSLDHCMMLKEKSGCDQDLFKAERKMKKMQRKHEEAMKKSYKRESERSDVFSFINSSISRNDGDVSEDQSKISPKELQNKSIKGLNVTSLQISQDLKKLQQEKEKLSESLIRHSTTSVAYSNIRDKIKECDDKLFRLESSEKKVLLELQQRNDRKKLTVF